MKTRKARLQRTLARTLGELSAPSARSLKEQHAALTRRLRGHYGYFGVNGNARSLEQVWDQTGRLWLKGLRRRETNTGIA